MTTLEKLRHHAPILHATAHRYGLSNLRVFGSVMKNSTCPNDIDLLVDPSPSTSLLDLGGMQYESQVLLGIPVDVLTPEDMPADMHARVLAEAQAL